MGDDDGGVLRWLCVEMASEDLANLLKDAALTKWSHSRLSFFTSRARAVRVLVFVCVRRCAILCVWRCHQLRSIPFPSVNKGWVC
jgi:hypothetical protein